MAFKLVVSNRVEFDVKFTLNDGGEAKPFGLRLSALRLPQDELDAEFKTGCTVGEFLKARQLTMLAWIGKSPLETDEGHPVAPGAEALQALMDLVPNGTGLVYSGWLEANGARGKSGN